MCLSLYIYIICTIRSVIAHTYVNGTTYQLSHTIWGKRTNVCLGDGRFTDRQFCSGRTWELPNSPSKRCRPQGLGTCLQNQRAPKHRWTSRVFIKELSRWHDQSSSLAVRYLPQRFFMQYRSSKITCTVEPVEWFFVEWPAIPGITQLFPRHVFGFENSRNREWTRKLQVAAAGVGLPLVSRLRDIYIQLPLEKRCWFPLTRE